MPRETRKEEEIILHLPHTFYIVHCPHCDLDFSYQIIFRFTDDYGEKQVDYQHLVKAGYCPWCGKEISND